MYSGKVAKRNSAKYKPPGNLIEAIAAGRLLLLSLWPHYVPSKGRCTRAECTAMNTMAEAIANAAVERGSQCGQSNGDSISCQRTIRESQQTAAISLQASSKARSDKAASNASVTNVTHFRVRITLQTVSDAFFADFWITILNYLFQLCSRLRTKGRN